MKQFLTLVLAAASFGALNAGTILQEDFETGNTGSSLTPVTAGSGWTVVKGYNGPKTEYNWYNYYSSADGDSNPTISGNCCACVEAPMFSSAEDGFGPREEILLSPELNLDDTYQLEFKFRVSPVNHYDNQRYDLQVRVVEDGNLSGAETVFSIQNEKMLRECGVSEFPVSTWSTKHAKVDLSSFKGEKVQLAFVYKMMTDIANLVWLDDIEVHSHAPATTPVASATLDRHDFGQMYIGEKHYSDVITLTNTGTDGLKITGFDFPEGIGLSIDPADVDLLRYQSVNFRLSYTASLTSPASGTAVIHTNGGDLSVDFTAAKMFVPQDCLLETFEEYFPPAGWTSNGWSDSSQVIEGDHSAFCDGGYGNSTLRSPRIDLTEGGKVSFSYANLFNDDEETLPYYNISLQVSYDGGENWKTKWQTPDDPEKLNCVLTETVDLGFGDDNCYIRWYYPAVESDDYGAFPHSSFLLDRVLLPNVAGMGGTPGSTKLLTPANQAEGVYPKEILLSWSPAQFADGYKLYVGTDSQATDLINGLDLGKALSYVIPEAAYETTYRWKVVGYNAKGDAVSTPTWRFTTQPDASVSSYPYEENFDKGEIPAGWISTPSETYSREWYVNSYYPYQFDGKKYNAMTSFWLVTGDENDLRTQEFILPDDQPMSISFIWGDSHPSDLVVDQTGSFPKQNVEPNNGNSENFFQIHADGEWTTLSTLSEKSFDGDRKYWHVEKLDLTPYQGQKVQFRWLHKSLSGQDQGCSLTHVVVEANTDYKGSFNLSEWKAGKVNHSMGVSSGEIFTLFNNGTKDLTLKNVSFGTPNFSTTLEPGLTVPADGSRSFSLTFSALDSAQEIEDEMTLEFEGGYRLSLPVSATALPKSTLYFSFEPNPLEKVWDEEMTMIDADRGINFSIETYWVNYTAGGQKGAFSVESDSKEDGMYGMMAPISGLHALVAACPTNCNADNWIISPKLKASAASKFRFFARNWECNQSVLPDPAHIVSVLVSTTSNTNTADFTAVLRPADIPFCDDKDWNEYEVDLSAYDGQEIYVALRHTTNGTTNLAFFDDFSFEGFGEGSGLNSLDALNSGDCQIFNANGLKVAEGDCAGLLESLPKGIYIVRINCNGSVKTLKVVR